MCASVCVRARWGRALTDTHLDPREGHAAGDHGEQGDEAHKEEREPPLAQVRHRALERVTVLPEQR